MSADNESDFSRKLAVAMNNVNLEARPVRLQRVIDRQAARIEALEAGLKPFADEVISLSMETQGWPDNERPVWEDENENIACDFTLGDLRHAASLLEPKP